MARTQATRSSTGVKPKLSTRKSRTCLGIKSDGTYCGTMFVSDGPHHRFCRVCAYYLKTGKSITPLSRLDTRSPTVNKPIT